MGLLRKLFWFALFFALFAFALNNQQNAVIHWFFGIQWQGPMVFVVLVVFGLGCLCGVLAMSPLWWQSRRRAWPGPSAKAAKAAERGTAAGPARGSTADMPAAATMPRDGV